MNHRPFEDWLHEGQPLSAEQSRDLQAHLRECRECAALAEIGLALRAARPVAAPAGFSARFGVRLHARRRLLRRRMVLGFLFLAFGGLGLLAWLAGPYLLAFVQAPAAVLTAWLSYVIFVFTALQALFQTGPVLVRVLPGFIPPFAWAVIASALCGMGLLWAVSIWKFTSVPKGA